MFQKFTNLTTVFLLAVFVSGCSPSSGVKWIEYEPETLLNADRMLSVRRSSKTISFTTSTEELYKTYVYSRFTDEQKAEAAMEKIRKFLASDAKYLKLQ